jgi:hypothetical protein
VHQSVVIAGAGTADERRLEVLEDARITPAMRELMWGGSKDPHWLLAQPGIAPDPGLAHDGFRRGMLRLVDRDGNVLAERRLDCELGLIAEPALPQAGGLVWGVGDDCSTGEGDFAGLITRFLVPAPDRIHFEAYRDTDGRELELTLVTAHRIRWHSDPKGVAETVREVSSHPDFEDRRMRDLKPGEPPPADLPWVVEYLTYRWDAGAGLWLKTARTERDRQWDEDQAWPDAAEFPGAGAAPSPSSG